MEQLAGAVEWNWCSLQLYGVVQRGVDNTPGAKWWDLAPVDVYGVYIQLHTVSREWCAVVTAAEHVRAHRVLCAQLAVLISGERDAHSALLDRCSHVAPLLGVAS